MAVNNINSISGSYYNYSNAINQLKLEQSLGKNTVSKNYYDKKYQNAASATMKDSQAFITKYNSSMSDMLQKSNALKNTNLTGIMNETSAVSSNTEVASAVKKFSWDRSTDQYALDVKQLASAQTNMGESVYSSDRAKTDANLNIQTQNGSASISVSATDAKGVQKTNKQLLTDVAKEINNQSGLGVKASVVEKDGKSSLQITSSKTGADGAFTVSGAFSDASNLNRAQTTAQDAIYSVRENGGPAKDYTSATNDISLGNGKVGVTLKEAGSTNIAMAVDSDKVISAVEDLIKSYNSALGVLNDNADRGTGVKRQLANMLNGPAADSKLEMVGITTKKDGTLVLDKDKMKESFAKDPSITKDIIGGANSIASGIFADARSGLSASSSSLINNDVKTAQKQTLDDPIQFTNMFSRRGAFNMINYNTIGMMFNMLV